MAAPRSRAEDACAESAGSAQPRGGERGGTAGCLNRRRWLRSGWLGAGRGTSRWSRAGPGRAGPRRAAPRSPSGLGEAVSSPSSSPPGAEAAPSRRSLGMARSGRATERRSGSGFGFLLVLDFESTCWRDARQRRPEISECCAGSCRLCAGCGMCSCVRVFAGCPRAALDTGAVFSPRRSRCAPSQLSSRPCC